MASLYLATVRRAIVMPSFLRASTRSSSERIASVLSALSRVFSRDLMAFEENPAEPSVFDTPLVKKYFSSNTPRGVPIYLLLVTRLTVLSCIPMILATSFSTSGFRYSTP